jgi:hypothetical protein
VTRFRPRKSLLVVGLLITVLGSSAATAAAATAATSTTAHPAASAAAAHPATAVHPATAAHRAASATAAHPATTSATTKATAATAYPAAFIATVTSAASTPSGPSPSGATPAGATPALTAPAGSGPCSVPGIGDIGNLLGFCHQGGLLGGLNNICQPSIPQPESATGGIDSIIRPPASPGPGGKTLYDNYGLAGQYWAATDLTCSDMTSLIGNNVAGMVFDASKAVDRVTITVYQSAAGNGILSWLSNVVNRLITSLGNAIYFPYLAPVVLLGVMWLAWHGLIRKRATRTIEGTIWMVVACAAAIWLIGRPADFTGAGQSVSNGVTQVLNVAFSKLPNPGQGNCVPVASKDPQSPGASFGFTPGNGLVDQNANELWSALVCKPWLDGEFGTTQFAAGRTGQTPVNTYGRQLLWAQAIAANETPTAALIKAKQSTYQGIAASIKQNDPAIYPLFQGNQWTSRLEIGFAALFAALVAGVLVLLIAITLIILKLGFLLLLIAGPFFLIIGTHPGFGRVVAMRWVEMIIGVLLKQVAVAIVLSVLLYAYSLIMGTTDAVLPWALKILMIALVTIAVFIYRKPFQHLFSAVGYGSVGARERSEIEMYRSREVLRRSSLGTAAAVAGASGYAGYRTGRWSRRGSAQSAALAEYIAHAGGSAAGDASGAKPGSLPNAHGQTDTSAQPGGTEAADGELAGTGARAAAGGNGRSWAAMGTDGTGSAAPPLHLPSRSGEEGQAAPSGWARGAVEGTAWPRARAGDAPPRPITPRPSLSGPGPARHASGNGGLPPRPGGAGGAPPRTGGSAGAAPRAGGAGGVAPRSGGPAPRVSGAGGVAPRSGGPAPRAGSASGPAPRPGGAGGPAPQAGSSAGPPPRTAASGRGPAAGGQPRARWGSETAQGGGSAPRGGRPLWQPGPVRPSGGWSGGSGSRPGPEPRQSPPQPSYGPAPSGPAAQYPSGPSGGGPAGGGGAGGGGGQAGSPQRSRNGSFWPGRGSSGAPRRGGGTGNGRSGNGGSGSGAAGNGAAGNGNGAAGPPPSPGGGRSEAGPREAPAPFWLKPVRRKK